jgi:hypothetical protein
VLHSWDFLALLSPCCIPTVTRRRAPLAPSPFLLATRIASLHPPPCPCLAPPAVAPPSPFLLVVPRPRSVLRRPTFSLGFRARPNTVVWTERQGARATVEGPAVRDTGASSPAACLLSPSFTLAPCAGGPSSRAQRRRRRPPSGARRPAPPPPSPATGGADLWQRGLRGVGRDSASASRSPPSRPPPQPPAPASALLILGAAGGNSRVSARRLARRLLELLLFCST